MDTSDSLKSLDWNAGNGKMPDRDNEANEDNVLAIKWWDLLPDIYDRTVDCTEESYFDDKYYHALEMLSEAQALTNTGLLPIYQTRFDQPVEPKDLLRHLMFYRIKGVAEDIYDSFRNIGWSSLGKPAPVSFANIGSGWGFDCAYAYYSGAIQANRSALFTGEMKIELADIAEAWTDISKILLSRCMQIKDYLLETEEFMKRSFSEASQMASEMECACSTYAVVKEIIMRVYRNDGGILRKGKTVKEISDLTNLKTCQVARIWEYLQGCGAFSFDSNKSIVMIGHPSDEAFDPCKLREALDPWHYIPASEDSRWVSFARETTRDALAGYFKMPLHAAESEFADDEGPRGETYGFEEANEAIGSE